MAGIALAMLCSLRAHGGALPFPLRQMIRACFIPNMILLHARCLATGWWASVLLYVSMLPPRCLLPISIELACCEPHLPCPVG